ncbi:unnamed protein product [Diatraea saccharalis]|uniref:Cyclic nucleotide-binding domain-containing protein n=1 Tax=Diatraea saccharalis TaxID=40085 RepID=A0A9N9QYR5_9NEOP|nr:unnamed protein product [Diatraea saccharalis]
MEDTLVFMYERALREVPIFGKVERSFIRVFTQHLREMYFLKGDTVIQCHDVQSYIYIIYRGKVDVLSSYNEMITCMGPGGMFGNFSGQPIACSSIAIYSSRSLDLLVIPSQTFFNLIKYYPKIQEPLNKVLETSKDYIMPITVNIADDNSSGSLTITSSFADTSQANRSLTASTSTNYSYSSITNILRPGSWLFQLPVLLHQTPYVRRCDLMTAMFGHHLRNCYLFVDTEQAFLRQLASVLDYTVFFPGYLTARIIFWMCLYSCKAILIK